ncbi:MAG: hypothetical protein ACRD0X_05320 [Thermoanaerobaculia bacterium]
MRRGLARFLILGLVWFLTPALTEAAENVWHFLRAGHAAHAVQAGADHAPAGAEHGCSGTFHLCTCHFSMSWEPVADGPPTGQPPVGRMSRPARGQLLAMATPDVFHPPQA